MATDVANIIYTMAQDQARKARYVLALTLDNFEACAVTHYITLEPTPHNLTATPSFKTILPQIRVRHKGCIFDACGYRELCFVLDMLVPNMAHELMNYADLEAMTEFVSLNVSVHKIHIDNPDAPHTVCAFRHPMGSQSVTDLCVLDPYAWENVECLKAVGTSIGMCARMISQNIVKP